MGEYKVESFTEIKSHHKHVFSPFFDLIQEYCVAEELVGTSPTVFPPSSLFYSYNIIDCAVTI